MNENKITKEQVAGMSIDQKKELAMLLGQTEQVTPADKENLIPSVATEESNPGNKNAIENQQTTNPTIVSEAVKINEPDLKSEVEGMTEEARKELLASLLNGGNIDLPLKNDNGEADYSAVNKIATGV